MQIFPPTVAVFQILNDERNERQHWPISGAATQSAGAVNSTSLTISQVAAISRPLFADGQRLPAKGLQIDQPAEMGLKFREQPRTSRQPRVALAPANFFCATRGVYDFRYRIQIHSDLVACYSPKNALKGKSVTTQCKWFRTPRRFDLAFTHGFQRKGAGIGSRESILDDLHVFA